MSTGAPKPWYEGCGGPLVRVFARAMAWRRRRHMLLVICGRYGLPVGSAAGTAAVGAAPAAAEMLAPLIREWVA